MRSERYLPTLCLPDLIARDNFWLVFSVVLPFFPILLPNSRKGPVKIKEKRLMTPWGFREEMDGSCIRNWEQLWLERKANENKKLLEKYKYNCANNAKSKGLLNNIIKSFLL